MEHTLQHIGIIGAGAMGRGIAQVCAKAGRKVYLFDTAEGAVERAIAAVREDLELGVRKGKVAPTEVESTLQHIQHAASLQDLAGCDLVVEAIIEKLEPKQALLKQLEEIVSPDCILASNTSSLSVTAIAAACTRPERIAGWHFFNPVTRMLLVEVIEAPRTAPDVVQALVELTQHIGHRSIVVSDSPGFVVNHAGRAFVTEGLKLLAERTADHTSIDAIMRAAGFRMGPLELLDLTGLDVSVPVMESIHTQYYGDDRYRPVALARTRMVAGLLGRKSGRGFYRYDGHTPTPEAAKPQAQTQATSIWWPLTGPAALPAPLQTLLAPLSRVSDPHLADIILLAPLGADLSSTVAELGMDAEKSIAIDPLFSHASHATLMVTAATDPQRIERTQSMLAELAITSHVIADSPGYVAPRVIACIINLVCEMAQQGIAAPADIDAAMKLALGYPAGPFEWGDQLGSAQVLEILQGLYACFGDQRYRPSPWLQRRARLGLPLSAPDKR